MPIQSEQTLILMTVKMFKVAYVTHIECVMKLQSTVHKTKILFFYFNSHLSLTKIDFKSGVLVALNAIVLDLMII